MIVASAKIYLNCPLGNFFIADVVLAVVVRIVVAVVPVLRLKLPRR
jgi:hypothetical protein